MLSINSWSFCAAYSYWSVISDMHNLSVIRIPTCMPGIFRAVAKTSTCIDVRRYFELPRRERGRRLVWRFAALCSTSPSRNRSTVPRCSSPRTKRVQSHSGQFCPRFAEKIIIIFSLYFSPLISVENAIDNIVMRKIYYSEVFSQICYFNRNNVQAMCRIEFLK